MEKFELSKSIGSLRMDARIIYFISLSQRKKHLSSGAFGVLVVWLSGAPEWVCALLAGLVLFCEILTSIGAGMMPANSKDAGLGPTVLMAMIGILSCSAFTAMGAAVLLYGSAAFIFAGLTMAFGIIAHVTATYAAFPLFSQMQIIPALGLLSGAIYRVHDQQILPSYDWEWILASVVLVIYTANMMEVRSKVRETSRALFRTQGKATAQLKELEHRSRHDSLTGLLNRKAFDERLAQELIEDKSQFSLMLLDLNGFKPINDSYSHEAGDTVLREIAKRIDRCLGEHDMAARLGGDEFVVAQRKCFSADQALALGQSLLDAIAQPVAFYGTQLTVTASAGVARSSSVQTDPTQLLAQADQAMYYAKSNTLNIPIMYRAGMFVERPSLQDQNILVTAMDRHEFRPFYQPKVDMHTGKTVGFEALARWVKPNGVILAPNKFIPMLDELGMQGDFVLYMTRAVLRDLTGWLEQGLDPGTVSINLSEGPLATTSARNDLIAEFNRYPLARGHVTLEITEEVFITRSGGQIRESIRALRKEGLLISLDDFGTGFASFQHLRDLEFDEIKIDTSFVQSVQTDRAAEILVAGLISIARGLDLQIVAEGVETQEQCDILVEMGCTIAQGYLWAKALPEKKAAERMREQLNYRDVPAPFLGIEASSAG